MIRGRRIKLPQWIEGRTGAAPFVVRVGVEAVIPDADPAEPCFEPDALRILDEAQRFADAGDVERLASLGDVYWRKTA